MKTTAVLTLAVIACFFASAPRAVALGEYVIPVEAPILRGPNVDADPLCLAPKIFSADADLRLAEADVLGAITQTTADEAKRDATRLDAATHAAQSQGLDPALSNPGYWRAVSFRVDLCDFGEGACEPEFRVVAQPFLRKGMFVVPYDDALHFIYRLSDVGGYAETVAGLQGAVAGDAATDFSRLCASGLRDRIKTVLTRYAAPKNLLRVGWMTSSASGQEWTFGQFARTADGGLAAENVGGDGVFDNFSKLRLLLEACPLNDRAPEAQKALFGCVHDPAAASGMLSRLQDPKELRRPKDHCAVCHTLATSAKIHALGGANDGNGVPILAKHGVILSNLRQFGYSLRGAKYLSDRVRSISNAP
jgi:hypothetical protein